MLCALALVNFPVSLPASASTLSPFVSTSSATIFQVDSGSEDFSPPRLVFAWFASTTTCRQVPVSGFGGSYVGGANVPVGGAPVSVGGAKVSVGSVGPEPDVGAGPLPTN